MKTENEVMLAALELYLSELETEEENSFSCLSSWEIPEATKERVREGLVSKAQEIEQVRGMIERIREQN